MPAPPPPADEPSERPEEAAAPGEPPAVPEEEWEKFLNDSEGRIRATAPKEPSARARQVARRLREQDELAARRRAKRRERWKVWKPRRGRSAAGRSPAGARRTLRTVLILVLVVGLALLVLNPSAALSLWSGH